jgi:hypothetical protein
MRSSSDAQLDELHAAVTVRPALAAASQHRSASAPRSAMHATAPGSRLNTAKSHFSRATLTTYSGGRASPLLSHGEADALNLGGVIAGAPAARARGGTVRFAEEVTLSDAPDYDGRWSPAELRAPAAAAERDALSVGGASGVSMTASTRTLDDSALCPPDQADAAAPQGRSDLVAA